MLISNRWRLAVVLTIFYGLGFSSVSSRNRCLTITKLLTEIMGGEILAQSRPGEGHHVHGAIASAEASTAAQDLKLLATSQSSS
jgi:hypothetical protein